MTDNAPYFLGIVCLHFVTTNTNSSLMEAGNYDFFGRKTTFPGTPTYSMDWTEKEGLIT
jgi:hypothetical protein